MSNEETGGIEAGRLRTLIERIERLEEERKGISLKLTGQTAQPKQRKPQEANYQIEAMEYVLNTLQAVLDFERSYIAKNQKLFI